MNQVVLEELAVVAPDGLVVVVVVAIGCCNAVAVDAKNVSGQSEFEAQMALAKRSVLSPQRE